MREVAALAGASVKTVSRVINDEPGVSASLASRVQAAIERLDYRPNLTASTLRRLGWQKRRDRAAIGSRHRATQALVAKGRDAADVRYDGEPVRAPGEVVVAVAATSLNRGDLSRLEAGGEVWRLGWDFAGTVVEAGEHGLPVGTRVVGIATGGAWSERVSLPVDWVAELPDELGFEHAAALPTAGLTALRILRVEPGTLGRRVVVMGAEGGVGRFAVQLAHHGGAEVTAVVRSAERRRGLRELGANNVAVGLADLHGPYDLALDAAGGDSIARLTTLLTGEGTLVVYGNNSNQPSVFGNVRDFCFVGHRRIQGFEVFNTFAADPPGRDLRYLAVLVARGRLNPRATNVSA